MMKTLISFSILKKAHIRLWCCHFCTHNYVLTKFNSIKIIFIHVAELTVKNSEDLALQKKRRLSYF